METRRVRGALLISFLLLIKVLLMLVVSLARKQLRQPGRQGGPPPGPGAL